MSKVDELKPCPFCGNSKVAQGASRDYISVWCDCGARGPEVPFPEYCDPLPQILKCYEAWNRRATPSEGGDGALREALKLAAEILSEMCSHGHITTDADGQGYREYFVPVTVFETIRAALALPAAAGWQTLNLEQQFRPIAGYDKEQPGYQYRVGWNAAIRHVMDLQRAIAPTSKTGGDPASTGAGDD